MRNSSMSSFSAYVGSPSCGVGVAVGSDGRCSTSSRVPASTRRRRNSPALSRGSMDPLWTDVLKLERGAWNPDPREPPGQHLGYIILDGLLGRRVLVPDRGRSLELLAEGDLVRPWQEDAASFSQVSWTVIEPTQLASLNETFISRARERPELLEALTDRALRRSRRLTRRSGSRYTGGEGSVAVSNRARGAGPAGRHARSAGT